ncbi:MAG: glycosyltransferase, partial [Clostridiales bacterium]|nr:glycosyltransferase [Clostridiales bacterium]
MKKVLQVSKQMYPFIGGIEQVARDIANALPKDEYEQKIICFNEDAEDGKYVCRRKETVKDTVDGVEVIRCGCIAKVASQSISFSYPRQLKKVFEDFNPDIVVFHYPNPYVATFLMKRIKENMKFILYWHLDITKQRMLGRLFHSQSVKLLRRADAVVAASPNYIEGSPYLAMYKDKCTVIPNCVDLSRLTVTEEIKKNSDDLRSSMDGKTICFACGRHVPYKGYTYLVKASKLLPDSFSICIGGKGELTDQLKKEAEGDDKIQFLGRLSDEELLTYLLACDIFCFPSITKNEAYG